MVAIEAYQILIVVVFLGLLFAVQVWLRKNPKRFIKHQTSRLIKVMEVTHISPQERVTLVHASGQEFLIYTSKASGSAMIQITPPTTEAAVTHSGAVLGTAAQ